jgi:hypothetical protein
MKLFNGKVKNNEEKMSGKVDNTAIHYDTMSSGRISACTLFLFVIFLMIVNEFVKYDLPLYAIWFNRLSQFKCNYSGKSTGFIAKDSLTCPNGASRFGWSY